MGKIITHKVIWVTSASHKFLKIILRMTSS